MQRRMTTIRTGKQSMAGCGIWALQKQPKSVHKHPEVPIYLPIYWSIHPCSDLSINVFIFVLMYFLNIFEYWAHENWWCFLWNMNNACCCFSPKYRFTWFISVTQPAMNHPILGGSSQLNSKWLIAMGSKSFPLPSGRFHGLYMEVIPNHWIKSWDDKFRSYGRINLPKSESLRNGAILFAVWLIIACVPQLFKLDHQPTN